ncbi:DUF4382 domain-containing protein [Saccharospirillum alexandrii]|uniref:DUF4382 domain-containing protein n=1 Tax=Saccharospirillum alexandrii TaxID=2448477 RepID=UPI003736497F
MSLDITDAPIDSASEVNVVFEGVDIRSASGALVEITYDEPRTINLLDLQGGTTASLLDDETLAAGDYEWIRLRVDATQEAGGSNIVLDGGEEHDLFIPSGAQTGLKLVSGFTVPVDGSVAFTIDFDLRKSVVEANGSYRLKPALRLVDNSEVGSISGTVSSTAVTENCSGAVYVYEGADVSPGDVGGEGNEPLVTALVDTSGTGVTGYDYTVAFLTEGDYTVAFTCDADQDDPEAADTLTFTGTQNASVSVDASVSIDF